MRLDGRGPHLDCILDGRWEVNGGRLRLSTCMDKDGDVVERAIIIINIQQPVRQQLLTMIERPVLPEWLC